MVLLTLIKERLRQTFAPSELVVEDESYLHAGHAGSQGGGQHFSIVMTAKAFTGLNRVRSHQLVYACLHDLMQPPHEQSTLGYIHALKLQLQS